MKGVFTRNRQPKMAAYILRQRYWQLAHMHCQKNFKGMITILCISNLSLQQSEFQESLAELICVKFSQEILKVYSAKLFTMTRQKKTRLATTCCLKRAHSCTLQISSLRVVQVLL
jgi:hypothetical protein